MKTIEEVASDINDYVELSSMLEMTCKYYNIELAASPLYNFRDVLSHFICLYEAADGEEKAAQTASIEEHLYRGLKDGCILIINNMKGRSYEGLNASLTKTAEQQRAVRKILHIFKKLEIEIRKNSESAIIRELTPFVEQLHETINQARQVFKQYRIDFEKIPV